MVNQAILIGNLGADPETNTTKAGKAVTNFRMATKNYNDTPEWHNVVAFDKLAEIAGKYLTKGKQVFVQGRLQTRSYEDKEGNKRYTTEIVANDIKFLGSKGDGPSRVEEDEDDLPF
ncbi:MAG TPA: single-stranded DNA-binding protein [Candidatus Paceibacterota bacterium]